MEFCHIPIMLDEVIAGLNIKPNGTYVDCTLGGAGHSFYIAKNLSGKGKLVGIDKDVDALCAAKVKLANFENVEYVHNDFKNFSKILDDLGIAKVDGILIDLGVSSYQLDCAERGFSFRFDAELDMRMTQEQSLSAYDVVNTYTEDKLAIIIYEYGEEKFSRQIAKNIIKSRQVQPIKTTSELVKIIESSMPKKYVYTCGGASKKTFQAIRIEVNSELLGLEDVLHSMIDRLSCGGRLCVLSFHSLEDRIIKNVFKRESTDCLCPPQMPICTCGHKAKLKHISKKPLVASNQEQISNPRSTCAKLRIAEKI